VDERWSRSYFSSSKSATLRLATGQEASKRKRKKNRGKGETEGNEGGLRGILYYFLTTQRQIILSNILLNN
jgi:hypothetical protein